MADISHHQFIALLKKSNVIDEKKLQPWLDQSTKIESARKLAKSLVEQEFLTSWQAKFLLSGRYRLRIGNYFLLSRLRRDELGARYLAIHATLNRKVELQIFSRDLTSDTQGWKDMIQKASLVAKLDHSALVHVYDIDHDDDRYFLVVEHVPGRSLDAQKEILTTPQIGKLILQCVEGIVFAHQNNVVHGTIDQSDVILTDKGTVKLQNLTVSPMRNQNNDEPEAKPEADFKALAKLGKKLMSANPGSDNGSGADLVKIFASMKTDHTGAVDKLKQWVAASPDAALANSQVTQSGANPIFSSTLGSSSEVDLSNLAEVTYEPDAPDEDEAEDDSSSASLIAAAKASPPFLIACAISIVMFLGIATYGISRVYNNMVTEPAAKTAMVEAKLDQTKAERYKEQERKQFEAWQAKQKNKDETDSTEQPVKNNKKETQQDKPKTSEPKPNETPNETPESTDEAGADEPKTVESTSESESTPESEPTKPEEKPNKFLDIFGEKNKPAEESNDDTKEGSIPEIAAGATPDKLTSLTNIGPVLQKTLYASGIKTYKQISAMTPATLDKVLADGGASKIGEKKWAQAIAEAKPLAAKVKALSEEHFRNVPKAFVLPPIESTKPVVLTKVAIPANYFLTAELIAPEGVSQRRVFFELKNDASAEEKWTVSTKKNQKSSKGNEIATFEKSNGAFLFAWTAEAAKDKAAVYLKNCLVRMSTPDGRTCVSKLRKPITTVRSLRISKEKLIDEISFEIDAMPHTDKIQIQLGALTNKERTIEVINSLITPDSPAIINLRRREKEPLMNLQVAVKRSGKKLKMSAALIVNGAPVKTISQLASMQQQLEAVNANAQQRAKGKSRSAPETKQAAIAQRNAILMRDYLKSIDSLFEGGGGTGEAINFEVLAEFEDGAVVLVKSNKNKVDKKNKKKK